MDIKYDRTINAENMRQKDLHSLLKVFKILEAGDIVPDNVETCNDFKGNPSKYKIHVSTKRQDLITYIIHESERIPATIQITQGKKYYELNLDKGGLLYYYGCQSHLIRLEIGNLPEWFITYIINFIPYHTCELLAEYSANVHRVLDYADFYDLLKTPNKYNTGEPYTVYKYNKLYQVTILKQYAGDKCKGYTAIIKDNYNQTTYIIDTVAGYLIREENDGTLEIDRLYLYKNTYNGIIETKTKE